MADAAGAQSSLSHVGLHSGNGTLAPTVNAVARVASGAPAMQRAAAANRVAAEASVNPTGVAAARLAPAAAATGANADFADDERIIRRAAALRVKYRRHDGALIRIPVEQVGFHPSNRDGQPPSGSRCLELARDILQVGFDVQEANCGGVLVAARPGDFSIHDFNEAGCDGDPLLAPVAAGTIAYGSLSHSHLHQILRNVRGGLKVDLPDVCSSDGRFNLERLRAVDPDFAAAVDQGLQWEVLDWHVECEPDACAIIQAAANAKNSLYLLRHEMQAIAKLCLISRVSVASDVALDVEEARRRLARTLPEFAADPNFLDLYRFVLDLGGVDAPFLTDLRVFHEKFVDAKLRRLRLSTFAVANLLPISTPHLKIAAIKFAYRAHDKVPQSGFCDVLSQKLVKDVLADTGFKLVMHEAEQVLKFFHVTCFPENSRGPAILNKENRIKVLSNLDKDMFGVVFGHAGCTRGSGTSSGSSPSSRSQAVRDVGAKAYKRILALNPVASLPPYLYALRNDDPVAEPSAGLAPKVIQFIGGTAISTQDSIAMAPSFEKYAWAEFMHTAEVARQLDDDTCRSAILVGIAMLRSQLVNASGATEAELVTLEKGGEKKGVRVLAARDFAKHSLKLVPLVSSPVRITSVCNQGWAVAVRANSSGFSREMFLTMTASFPPPRATVADIGCAPGAPGSQATLFSHAWKPTHFPWPFWAVPRHDIQTGANCELQRFNVSVVVTGSSDCMSDPVVDTIEVEIPVLVNSIALSKGDELTVFWPSRPTKADPQKQKLVTWVEQASKKQKKS